jgi:hypothetical protein
MEISSGWNLLPVMAGVANGSPKPPLPWPHWYFGWKPRCNSGRVGRCFDVEQFLKGPSWSPQSLRSSSRGLVVLWWRCRAFVEPGFFAVVIISGRAGVYCWNTGWSSSVSFCLPKTTLIDCGWSHNSELTRVPWWHRLMAGWGPWACLSRSLFFQLPGCFRCLGCRYAVYWPNLLILHSGVLVVQNYVC